MCHDTNGPFLGFLPTTQIKIKMGLHIINMVIWVCHDTTQWAFSYHFPPSYVMMVIWSGSLPSQLEGRRGSKRQRSLSAKICVGYTNILGNFRFFITHKLITLTLACKLYGPQNREKTQIYPFNHTEKPGNGLNGYICVFFRF